MCAHIPVCVCVYMPMCVCPHAHVFVPKWTCPHAHVCAHVCIQVPMCAHIPMCVPMRVSKCPCVCPSAHVCTPVCVPMCVCPRANATISQEGLGYVSNASCQLLPAYSLTQAVPAAFIVAISVESLEGKRTENLPCLYHVELESRISDLTDWHSSA